MNYIESTEVVSIFEMLNKQNIDYILIRNIDDELPSSLKIGKDIDILVNKKDELNLVGFFKSTNYEAINHPHKDDVFLYGVDQFEFKYNNNNKILFDLNYQITVRSLDAGQWIPLDEIIQKSAWENKRFEQKSKNFGYWTLSYNDEFICLVTRSIFDKKYFQKDYVERINELIPLIDKLDVIEKFEMVFFKFTPYLLNLLEANDYKNIMKNYLMFKEY